MTNVLGMPLPLACMSIENRGEQYSIQYTCAPGREPRGDDWRVVRQKRTEDGWVLTACLFRTKSIV